MAQQAFILRIAPSGIDKVPEALTENQIIIGWAEAEGLLDANLTWEQFRVVCQGQVLQYNKGDRKHRGGLGIVSIISSIEWMEGLVFNFDFSRQPATPANIL